VLNFDVGVLLTYAVLVHGEVFPANVRDEVSVGILDQKFDCHEASGGIELELRSLLSLPARGIKPMKSGWGLGFGPPAVPIPIDWATTTPISRQEFSDPCRR
jgi:hypothetical protein